MSSQQIREAWSSVADELEGLGLKLKLHLEQELAEDDDESTEALFERLRERFDDAIDAVGNAAGDDAVRADLRETRERLVEAVAATFRTARQEVRRAATR